MEDSGWGPRAGPLGLRSLGTRGGNPDSEGIRSLVPARRFRSSWACSSLSLPLSDPSLAEGRPWALGVPSSAEGVRSNVQDALFSISSGRTQARGSAGWGRGGGAVRGLGDPVWDPHPRLRAPGLARQ